ncbi:N-acetylmuramoyl-L-alanine amidase [Metabacillus fastidiosus]|uniref:N-acetylmuramoyl-L-alanine amidase n=1 Tax=Metabacillus fastidiosus TaxID=1458 RepID=UPI002E1A6556|nr:N-acetylmuramoyl-L-alanine amidase [Metabacillus fastidiosus]
MKKLFVLTVLFICCISIILLIDSQSKLGILNSIEMNKNNNQEINNSLQLKSKQTVEVKNAEQTEEKGIKEKIDASIPAIKKESFIIVIDPGHQAKADLEQEPIGPGAKEMKYKVTGGTSGVITKKPEYVLTLEAANFLKSHLEKRGFQVIMTRSTHDVNISNRERAEIANNYKADLFVRIHADGSESSKTSGFSILAPARENPYTLPIYEDSYQAAQLILANIGKEIPLHQNGIFFRSDMSGFNWSEVPVILPEIGFMTNLEDDRKLSDSSYLSNLMELMASGIEEYAVFKKHN